MINIIGNQKFEYISSGIITTAKTENSDKILHISNEIISIIDQYKPDSVGIEETYVNINPATSLKLGIVRGAIILSVLQKSLPIFEYSPAQVKKTVVGNGRAEKQQVEYMIRILTKNIPQTLKTFDESDAIAIALTHALLHK